MSDRRYFNGNTTGETRYCLQGHTYAQRRVNRKKEPVKFTAPDPSSYLRGGGGVKATTGSFSKAPGSSPSSKPPPPPPLQNVGTVVAPYVRVLQVCYPSIFPSTRLCARYTRARGIQLWFCALPCIAESDQSSFP
jgi:hypothetical protein